MVAPTRFERFASLNSPSTPPPVHVSVAVASSLRRRLGKHGGDLMCGSASGLFALVALSRFEPAGCARTAAATGSSLLAFALLMRRNRVGDKPSRQIWFKLLSAAAGAVVAVLLVEIGLRVASGMFGEEVRQQLSADPRNYGIPDAYIGYRSRPDSTIVVSGKDFKAEHRV